MKRLWRIVRRQGPSMIRSTMAPLWRAWGFTSTGTIPPTSSTPAIWARGKGSSWSTSIIRRQAPSTSLWQSPLTRCRRSTRYTYPWRCRLTPTRRPAQRCSARARRRGRRIPSRDLEVWPLSLSKGCIMPSLKTLTRLILFTGLLLFPTLPASADNPVPGAPPAIGSEAPGRRGRESSEWTT
jgi:hypothetical protein